MPSGALPKRPQLDALRGEARALQRGVQDGDPGPLDRVAAHYEGGTTAFPLATAQLVVAAEYGFASWPRLCRYVEVVTEYGWDSAAASEQLAEPAAEFCRLACLTYTAEDGPHRWEAATRLLADLSETDIWAASAAGRPAEVRTLLAADPRLAKTRGGPFGWRPLCYLVYSRVEQQDAVAVARELLAAGADPTEGFLFDGEPYTFTPLTGVLGGGERNQPRHPQWKALARLLLEAGADPNDGQALYNNMFSPANEHLELLFEYGLGRPHDGAWRTRLGELIPTPAEELRTQLRWAIEHDQRARVRLLTRHGVDVRTPYQGDGPVWAPGDGQTPVELARLCGNTEIAEFLVAHGAPPARPDPVADLIAAVFRADRAEVEAIRARHPGVEVEARRVRPGLIVWAAAQAPVETAELLVELGFDVNALGRADAPVEQQWQTALHHSAGAGDVELTRRLLALGTDPDLRDRRFDATPLDWARHLGQPATVEILARGRASD